MTPPSMRTREALVRAGDERPAHLRDAALLRRNQALVNVVDDHTIDVTAEPAQPILPLLLSLVTIVPSETPVEFVRIPIGTGPYKLG